ASIHQTDGQFPAFDIREDLIPIEIQLFLGGGRQSDGAKTKAYQDARTAPAGSGQGHHQIRSKNDIDGEFEHFRALAFEWHNRWLGNRDLLLVSEAERCSGEASPRRLILIHVNRNVARNRSVRPLTAPLLSSESDLERDSPRCRVRNPPAS